MAFKKIGDFLQATKQLEHKAAETTINDGTAEFTQKVLSTSAVRATAYMHKSMVGEAPDAAFKCIQEGIQEATQRNAARMLGYLDELFRDAEVEKSREEYWVNKLCERFHIDPSLPYEEKKAIVDTKLSEDDATLNMVTAMLDLESKGKRE